MIKHNKPYFDISDQAEICSCLDNAYVAEGSQVEKFESDISHFLGVKYAIAVNSGTAAIFLALFALGVGKGSEVIMPTYVCSALLNATFMLGANPVLVDVNSQDFNINWEQVKEKVGKHTHAIIVPHIHGMPAFIPSTKYKGIPVLEDCATAIGSSIIEGETVKPVGGQAAVSVFSFYATKFLAVGEGGMICTDSLKIAKKIVDYREFDCVKNYYPRFNFQMSDLQGALGVSQLKKINYFLQRRKIISHEYDNVLINKGLSKQEPLLRCVYNNYRYIIVLSETDKNRLKKYLLNNGIVSIVPIDEFELLHNYLKLQKNRFPVAEKISLTTLSIPIYPAMGNEEIEHVIDCIKKF